MRRLLRTLKAAATLLMGVVLLAGSAAWVRSFRLLDEVSRVDAAGTTHAAVSFRGSLYLMRVGTNAPERETAWDTMPVGPDSMLGSAFEGEFDDWRLFGAARIRAPRPGAAPSATWTRIAAAPTAAAPAKITYPVVPWLGAGRFHDVLVVPYWPIVALTALPPTLAAARLVRRTYWKHNGRCGACGYDLRASPDRCPECGAAAPVRRRNVRKLTAPRSVQPS